MARPTRQGVDYFPLDVNLDSKFKFIEIKYGLEGFAIVIKILQQIYSAGYWYMFDEDEKLLFAHEINVDINLVNEVIMEALTREIFDKQMYEKYQILTSKGIQKRYKDIVKRRKDVEIVSEYLLIKGDFGVNVNIISVNVRNNYATSVVNDNKSTQSKVKESKVKESKVNIDTKVSMSVSTDVALEVSNNVFDEIMNFWNKNCLLKNIKTMTPKRKGAINARIKEHGIKNVYYMIELVNKSPFLQGQSKQGWTADFDWCFRPTNFLKIIEGKYLPSVGGKLENKFKQVMQELEGIE